MKDIHCEEREVTLMELLDSREARVLHQNQLMVKYKDAVLVSMMLNIPGPVKTRSSYISALKKGLERMELLLGEAGGKVVYKEFRPLVTGCEGYLCVEGLTPLDVKKEAISLEEADTLGRLFDVDVLTPSGGISRKVLNGKPRKCLLCDEDAKVCARSRRHDMDQLLDKIAKVLKEYE